MSTETQNLAYIQKNTPLENTSNDVVKPAVMPQNPPNEDVAEIKRTLEETKSGINHVKRTLESQKDAPVIAKGYANMLGGEATIFRPSTETDSKATEYKEKQRKVNLLDDYVCVGLKVVMGGCLLMLTVNAFRKTNLAQINQYR